ETEHGWLLSFDRPRPTVKAPGPGEIRHTLVVSRAGPHLASTPPAARARAGRRMSVSCVVCRSWLAVFRVLTLSTGIRPRHRAHPGPGQGLTLGLRERPGTCRDGVRLLECGLPGESTCGGRGDGAISAGSDRAAGGTGSDRRLCGPRLGQGRRNPGAHA